MRTTKRIPRVVASIWLRGNDSSIPSKANDEQPDTEDRESKDGR